MSSVTQDQQPADMIELDEATNLTQAHLADEHPQGHSTSVSDHHSDRHSKRHETKDANVGLIALIGAGMTLLGLLMFATLWQMLAHFRRTEAPEGNSASPFARQPPTPMPPRIEEATSAMEERFQAGETTLLHSSNDKHLSIEEAKTNLLRSGFPTRQPLSPQDTRQQSEAK